MDKSFIFLAGHHRSGTSLLHEILREHPLVSGFVKTGVPQDEGQHLQSIYKAAKAYGGPGKYIFDQASYMNEQHALATEASARAILEQWERHYDSRAVHYIEKSPPNLVRTRFLQKLFPISKFVVILRHPIAVSYATQKWSKTSIESLVEHSLRGYEILMNDIPYLKQAYIVRYEDFVRKPQEEINKIYEFLGLKPTPLRHTVHSNVNEKYFAMWSDDRSDPLMRQQFPITELLETRANRFGYSIDDYESLRPAAILGAHSNRT